MTERTGPEAPPPSGSRPRLHWGVALAILIVFIMVASGASAIQTPSLRSGVAPGAPSGGGAWISPMALQSGAQLQSDPTTTLAGAPLSNLANATVLGPAPASQSVWFTVGFPLQNQSELAQIINEQGLPGSPMYQHWLTNAQEQRMFGPPASEVQDTVNYFTSMGFHLGTSGTLSDSFEAPVSLVDSAFHTTLSEVRYSNGTSTNTTIANTQPLQVPSPIAAGISAIDGLSGPGNYRYYHSESPQLMQAIQAAEAGQAGGAAAMAQPATAPIVYNATLAELFNYSDQAFTWFSINYPFHRQLETARWQSLSAATLNQMYQANPLLAKGYNGNSTGKPITIAIVMEGGINPGDLEAYSQLVYNNPNQIVNRVTPDPIDGAYTWNGTFYYTDGASGEMALDIEYSSTMAPGAHIIPVYSQAFFGNMLDDQYAALDSMSPTPNIISNSWGGPEDEAGTLYTPGIGSDLVMHEYFMLLDAKGASILASSGDGGGFDGTTGILSGSFPASDPYVLSVDGLRSVTQDQYGYAFPWNNSQLTYGNLQTFVPLLNGFTGGAGVDLDMKVTKADGIRNQSYWYIPISNLTLYDAPPSASGGFGFSYFETQPWWQHAVGVPNVGRSLGSGVAAEADFNMSIFFDGVVNWLYGGTSFACPTTAGMFADIEDYLVAHGHKSLLGNPNVPVWEVANAWQNGNLSLTPFYDVNNGSSYWGNFGSSSGQQYSWPPGQNFPMVNGSSTYGNTVPGWDFPTGWGSINVYNFALDLNQLENEEGFYPVNTTGGNHLDEPLWFDMTLNQTYNIAVNATSAISTSNPVVTVEYFPQGGSEKTWTITGGALTAIIAPTSGLMFTLNTGAGDFAPAYAPGLLIFTLGTTGNRSVGFGFDWVNPSIPSGTLSVSVLNPGTGSIVGGCASANVDNPIGNLVPPLVAGGLGCFAYSEWSGGASGGVLYENTFAVKVVDPQGKPVYNAVVTATVPQLTDLAWIGSRAEAQSNWYGRGAANSMAETNDIVSETFTNITGVALVQTWNMAYAAPYNITATYGPEVGFTSYMVTPAPNVQPLGIDNGKYAEYNALDLELYVEHAAYTNATENTWVQNFVNTSSLYDTIYAWQGQVMKFHVSNWTGAPEAEQQVWLGKYDTGKEYKFARYEPTGGVQGLTNSTNTVGYTNSNGDVSLTVPDNMSATNYFDYLAQAPLGIGAVSVDIPNTQNKSFNYVEKCQPLNRSNPNPIINCEFNNSYDRNYTSTPMWILPNPVNVSTMTSSRVIRNFFPTGANVSFQVNVSLPTEDPLGLFYFVPNGYNGNPLQWSSGLEHITGMEACVDGHCIMNITPEEPPQAQFWSTFVNLTGGSNEFHNGINTLTVYVNTSMGQEFSYTHTFIVASINESLNQNDLYTPIPSMLNWSVNIPSNEISNATFNTSISINYLGAGCPDTGCQVVNQSIRVNPGQQNYHQLLNLTLLESRGFYADSGELPTLSPYAVTIWYGANHSGTLRQAVSTQFVFNPLTANITGPTANATVPLGNVTIAYTYGGDYIRNASLYVYQNVSGGVPVLVYSQLAFVPGPGGVLREGSTTWTAVQSGNYWIELAVGSPNGKVTRGIPVLVQNENPPTTITKPTGSNPLFGLNAVDAATALVLISGIIGLLLGLWMSPTLRPAPSAAAAATPPKAWEEGKSESKSAPTSKNECSICHERFETPVGLTQHARVVHGVED